jgi:transposase
VGTIQGVAQKFGVHRRLVREAIGQAVPTVKCAVVRERPRVGPVVEFIDAILQADRAAPRKQRHTAHRIYTRICQERTDCVIAESTVRVYVRERRGELGLLGHETCVPQSYDWGEEGQVDWYEADAFLGGEQVTLQVFSLRSMASGAAFHRAYYRATQQAFLEGQQLAFQYFGGVFHRIRYDNLKSAVKRILQGYQRDETERFVAFRSHWRFSSEFCNPAQGHEKGGIENEVGRFRRAHWVPLPEAVDLAALNALVLARCRIDEGRTVTGRSRSVGDALVMERRALLPLAAEDFELAETSFPKTNGLGCVKVRTNLYSVPAVVGTTVEVKVWPSRVDMWRNNRQIASHERDYGRNQEVLDLEHYLDPLERKPGALAGSTPLEQWRKVGRWPALYDAVWEKLKTRLGRSRGTKEMIGLLQLGRDHGWDRLRAAVEQAWELGCHDRAAVQHLLETPDLGRPLAPVIDIGRLRVFERPAPRIDVYDQLLAAGGVR